MHGAQSAGVRWTPCFLFSHRLVRVEWCDVGILILSIKTSWQDELQINSTDLESASLGGN